MGPKVLMIGWELPPFHSGGLGQACYGLAKALSEKGVKITFVLPHKINVKADFMDIVFADIDESAKALQGAYMNYADWIKKFGVSGSIGPFDYINSALRYAENIGKMAKRFRSDIIHTHDWLTYPAGIAAKDKIGKPMVAHVHATEFDRTGGHYPNQIVYAIEKIGFETADRILPVGGYMKGVITEKYGINPDKITVVYNGIEDQMKKILPPALSTYKEMGFKVVLFLGRITLQKGPEYFVRAAKIVSDYNPKVIFVVTGSGDMQEYMISEAARLGILNKFIFTGFLVGEEIDKMYQTADLYVMPSVSEPFGMTALESISNGTPVLVSKQSGVSEVLRHALKVDFWDVDEMANKILAALKFKALPEDLKREGSKEIKSLTWSNAADKVLSVYNQLLI